MYFLQVCFDLRNDFKRMKSGDYDCIIISATINFWKLYEARASQNLEIDIWALKHWTFDQTNV